MIVCQGSAAFYMAWHLATGRARIRLTPRPIEWLIFKDILKVGGIGLFNSFFMATTVVVVTGFIGRYGTEALAGYGLGARLELMLVPLSFGIGAALTAAVGANFGARQYARARRAAWSGAAVTFIVTGAIGTTVAISPGVWLDMFTDEAGLMVSARPISRSRGPSMRYLAPDRRSISQARGRDVSSCPSWPQVSGSSSSSDSAASRSRPAGKLPLCSGLWRWGSS